MTPPAVVPGQVWTDGFGKMVQILGVDGTLATCDQWFEGTYDPHQTTIALYRFGPLGNYKLAQDAETDA